MYISCKIVLNSWNVFALIWPNQCKIENKHITFIKPTAVAEWVEHLCSEQEIPRLNPGILPLLSSACKERNGPPCHIHTYTVYTPIGGKGRCCIRHNVQDHHKQERVQARSTLDLKPMRKDTQSPKQEQSVAPRNGPWSSKKFKKNK